MRQIFVEEISSYKNLPFNLYNENGEVIFKLGEEITPGKLLKLKYITAIYSDDDDDDDELIQEYEETEPQLDDIQVIVRPKKPEESPDKAELDKIREKLSLEYEEKLANIKDQLDSEEDDEEEEGNFQYGMLAYENEMSCIPVKAQQEIKNNFKKAIKSTLKQGIEKSKEAYFDLRDQVVEETLLTVDDLIYKSQLKIYGEHTYTHGVNVSILSTVLAHKLRLPDSQIKDIALAAMLHDIGKIRLPKEIVEKQVLTVKESKLMQLHPQMGYRMIKKEMKLPEHIATIALEHHERNDGSGYPYGTSGELIGLSSQIVMICDVYDNLISNRGMTKVKNSKEAIKLLLDGGSKWFTPSILYTFVYMSNYNDTLPISPPEFR